MVTKNLWLACMAIGLSAVASAAYAKTVQMGPVSPSALEAACNQAGGASYADGGGFGCKAAGVVISCSAQACQADLSDMIPVTGNSLEYLLSGAGSGGGPTAIRPVDARVSARSDAQTSAASKVGY